MELVVHGTKGGYRTLYSTPGAPAIANDIRNNVSSENALGETSYAISFAAGGCVFTKYCIVRDSLRSYATGTVAFSLFLPAREKMAGIDVHTLLDKLLSHYTGHYIKDNNVNRGETTQIIQEDWTFVNDIITEYKNKLKSNDDENIQSGATDAAFIYYKDDAELQRYFEWPFQEEYSTFRQVLFINKELKGNPANPLNALRHSENDLTEKIELDNPQYKLLFNKQDYSGLRIEVKANGKIQSLNCKVRGKSNLEITYGQLYRISGFVSGTCQEIAAKYPQCITIDEQNKTITINSIQLKNEQRSLTVSVIDTDKRDISKSAIIRCIYTYSQSEKHIKDNQFVFEGDEIGESWNIEVKAEGYETKKEKYQPSKFPNERNTLLFKLEKQKIIEIQVFDNEKDITNLCKITVFQGRRGDKKKSPEKDNVFVFTGDEIDKEWSVEIEREGYKTKNEKITPISKDSLVKIELEKSSHPDPIVPDIVHPDNTDITISFSVEKHGRLINYNSNSSITIKKQELDHVKEKFASKIKPAVFYKFDKWEEKNRNSDDENRIYYVALFKPIISLKYSVIALGAIVAIVGTNLWVTRDKGEKPPVPIEYTQDNELYSEKLNELKTYYDNNKPKEYNFNIIDIILPKSCSSGNKQASISPEYEKWQADSTKIAKAIYRRKLINDCNFEELKNQNYSQQQQQKKFKEAIDKIDSLKYNTVRTQLGDVSKLALTEIADSIIAILTQKELEIQNYLQTDTDLDFDKIKEYLLITELVDTTLIPSLKLINDKFWAHVHNNESDFSTINNQVLTDPNLSQNEVLTNFLSTISVDSSYHEAYEMVTYKNKIDSLSVLRTKIKTTEKIINYLKESSELNSDTINAYYQVTGLSKPLNESLKLCITFWKIVHEEAKNTTFWTLKKSVEKDPYLKSNKKLNSFLSNICNDKAFEKYKHTCGIVTCKTLLELEEKLK
jgi:hypothetical protein